MAAAACTTSEHSWGKREIKEQRHRERHNREGKERSRKGEREGNSEERGREDRELIEKIELRLVFICRGREGGLGSEKRLTPQRNY